MSEPFIGEIKMFAGNFAPRGYAFCDGQLIAISQNQALFSLVGTTYGGDGRTTFALPDLRGRAPIHAGHAGGLSMRQLGSRGGSETNTLTVTQMPSHNHTSSLSSVTVTITPQVSSADGDTASPVSSVPAGSGRSNIYGSTPDASGQSTTAQVQGEPTIGQTGGNQPVNNMPPFLTINFIIALVGLYPSRS